MDDKNLEIELLLEMAEAFEKEAEETNDYRVQCKAYLCMRQAALASWKWTDFRENTMRCLKKAKELSDRYRIPGSNSLNYMIDTLII